LAAQCAGHARRQQSLRVNKEKPFEREAFSV
jgi:hypothetical protein